MSEEIKIFLENLAFKCHDGGIVKINIFDIPNPLDEFYEELEKAGLEVEDQIGDILTLKKLNIHCPTEPNNR